MASVGCAAIHASYDLFARATAISSAARSQGICNLSIIGIGLVPEFAITSVSTNPGHTMVIST